VVVARPGVPGGEEGDMEEEKGYGWIVMASILLVVAGIFNILWGVAALAKSELLVSRLLFGNLTFWGVVWLILGIIEMCAGFAILAKAQWARWFGIIMAALSMIGAFFYMWAFPGWSILIIALDVLVIYGLAEYGGRFMTLPMD
jgi:hypothetical protein